MKKILISIIVLANYFSVFSAVGSVYTTHITDVLVTDSYVLVTQEASVTTYQCSDNGERFLIDLSDAYANSLLSAVLTSKTTGATVDLKGKGTCYTDGGTTYEKLNFVRIK